MCVCVCVCRGGGQRVRAHVRSLSSSAFPPSNPTPPHTHTNSHTPAAMHSATYLPTTTYVSAREEVDTNDSRFINDSSPRLARGNPRLPPSPICGNGHGYTGESLRVSRVLRTRQGNRHPTPRRARLSSQLAPVRLRGLGPSLKPIRFIRPSAGGW